MDFDPEAARGEVEQALALAQDFHESGAFETEEAILLRAEELAARLPDSSLRAVVALQLAEAQRLQAKTREAHQRYLLVAGALSDPRRRPDLDPEGIGMLVEAVSGAVDTGLSLPDADRDTLKRLLDAGESAAGSGEASASAVLLVQARAALFESEGRLTEALAELQVALRHRTADHQAAGWSEAAILMGLARILGLMGKIGTAEETLLRAMRAVGSALDGFNVRCILADVRLLASDVAGARQALAEAEAVAADIQGEYVAAMLAGIRTRTLLATGRFGDAIEAARSSVDRAESSADHAERLPGALAELAAALEFAGREEESLAVSRRALNLARSARDTEVTCEAAGRIADLLCGQRRFSEAAVAMCEAEEAAGRTGSRFLRLATFWRRCDVALGLGATEDAERWLVEALRLHGASEDVGDACETMCRVVAVRTSQSRFEEGEQALVEFDAFRDAHPAFRPAEMGCRAAAMGAQLACARVRRLLGLPLHGDLPEGLPEAPHTDWAALGPALASAQSAAAVATEAAEAYGHASGDARQVRDARRLAAEVRRLHLAYGQEDAP